MAAQIVRAAQGQYSAARLSAYSDLLRQRFGTTSPPERMASYLPRGLRNLLARTLLKSERFCRTMVVENWFLRMNDGPLPRLNSLAGERSFPVAV
jgi:hypothetical protein